MKASVIIATLNEQENIERLLTSLKNQTEKGFETIIVDNFSKDKTIQIAKQFNCKIVTYGNERSKQRNYGANIAKSNWLIFLDADMQTSPEFIHNCFNFLEKQAKKTIVAIKEKSKGKNFWSKSLALEKNCYQDLSPLTASRIFTKSDFLKLGGYNPKMYAAEDWDITQRFLKKNFKLKLTPFVITHFEMDNNLIEILKKDFYYIKNIANYKGGNFDIFKKQSSLSLRLKLWLKSYMQLIKNPHLTLGFLFYKSIVFILWQTYNLKRNLWTFTKKSF